jgi:peptidoglycan-associated lipoprotein
MLKDRGISMRVALFAALSIALLAAGCARKPEAPPPPPPAPAPAPEAPPPAPMAEAPAAPAYAPGSQEDLVATVGTDRVFFAYDSYALDETARAVLQRQADWLQQNTSVRLTIEGHCDERGTREYNLALGDRRASAVRSFLVSLGVDPNRLNTISYGKERPEVLGSDEESFAKNRRGVSMVGAAQS